MKQHITEEQLGELDQEKLERLKDWVVSHRYDRVPGPWVEAKSEDVKIAVKNAFHPLPLLTIGQMIEFLDKNKTLDNFHALDGCYEQDGPDGWRVVIKGEMSQTFEGDELCDALWEAVREVLEK